MGALRLLREVYELKTERQKKSYKSYLNPDRYVAFAQDQSLFSITSRYEKASDHLISSVELGFHGRITGESYLGLKSIPWARICCRLYYLVSKMNERSGLSRLDIS